MHGEGPSSLMTISVILRRSLLAFFPFLLRLGTEYKTSQYYSWRTFAIAAFD